jgi:DNA-binding response OmpR family regulator
MENPRQDLLIVDDDNSIRTLISIAMQRHGLSFDVARDGEDALRQMRTGTYAVVLLDLMMPRMDGPEFLKQLATLKLNAGRRPIVLLMTAFSSDQLPVLPDSIHAIVRKPFDIDDLVALVGGCVEQRRALEAIQRDR